MQDTSREKPLLYLKIKIAPETFVNVNIYKDDTAFTAADRVFRHANF